MRDDIMRVTRAFGFVLDGDKTGINIDDFVSMDKKGCRRYRMVISGKRSKAYAGYYPRLIRSAITL
jgi:hypothetical protein